MLRVTHWRLKWLKGWALVIRDVFEAEEPRAICREQFREQFREQCLVADRVPDWYAILHCDVATTWWLAASWRAGA